MAQNTALLGDSESSISRASLKRFADGWLLDGDARQLSGQTLYARKFVVGKLLWYLTEQKLEQCGIPELRGFMAYCSNGHLEAGGRWGNPRETEKVRPSTVATYYRILRTLFRFLVAEGAMAASPADRVKPPVSRPDQVQPFTMQQVEALLTAARKSRHPKRDQAIVLLLLDTGLRASELCGLRDTDLDLVSTRQIRVMGKGNKRRSVPIDKRTARALWQYLEETRDDRLPGGPLFLSDRGLSAGESLTGSGLLQLIERLGKAAGIESVRCSPHTFRHTFAVMFLRSGGNTFTLQQLLGHTSLDMTTRYVQLAQADLENQHRQYSPVARLRSGRA